MTAPPDVIACPMASSAAQMRALDAAIAPWGARFALAAGSTEIVPVCETTLGVADMRAIAAASPRIRSALLGAEADRALVDGLWLEVPTYDNAQRLIERARRLASARTGR